MKTTNYDISKRLAEIGFEINSEAFFCYSRNTKEFTNQHEIYERWTEKDQEQGFYNSYDLETILEALQEKLPCNIKITSTEIKIENRPLFESPSMQFQFWEEKIERLDNESLADTAARLLILLHEKGIVKFKN